MIKYLVPLIVFFSLIMICGCQSKVRTPPWTDKEISEMENQEVDIVPICIIKR